MSDKTFDHWSIAKNPESGKMEPVLHKGCRHFLQLYEEAITSTSIEDALSILAQMQWRETPVKPISFFCPVIIPHIYGNGKQLVYIFFPKDGCRTPYLLRLDSSQDIFEDNSLREKVILLVKNITSSSYDLEPSFIPIKSF